MPEVDELMSFEEAKAQLKALKGAVDYWRGLAKDQGDKEGEASLARSLTALDAALEAMGFLEE